MGEQAESWERGNFSLNHAAGQSLCQKFFCLKTHPPLVHDNPCHPPHTISFQYFNYTVPSCSPWTSERSLWLLCNSWMASQDLVDNPAPPQWHPQGWKAIGDEESTSAVLSCFIFFFPPSAHSHGFSLSHRPKHLQDHEHRIHGKTTPHSGPWSFSAQWGCVRAYPQAAIGCLRSAAAEVKSSLCSHNFTKFCVWSRSVCAGVQRYCYFN